MSNFIDQGKVFVNYVGWGKNDLVSIFEDGRVKIKRYIVHPGFAPEQALNDIALVELENDIEFNDRVQPACLEKEVSSIFYRLFSNFKTKF